MSANSSGQQPGSNGVSRFFAPITNWTCAIVAQLRYGFPARKLKIIGVTGSEGKTTTTTLIARMLQESGLKVAVISSVSIDYSDEQGQHPNSTRLTDLSVFELMRHLKAIKKSRPDWLVLETNSFALSQHKVWGLPYSVAVMTNINHVHLDYYHTFEKYLAAKVKLFAQTNKHKRGLHVGIVNSDDPNAKYFAAASQHVVTYGLKSGDLQAVNINQTAEGSTFEIRLKEETMYINCLLAGSFNVYNALAAVGVGKVLGLKNEQIEAGIASLTSVEGRMMRIDEGQDFMVFVDYAQAPESLEKVFKELKAITQGRIITVFGSAGNRNEAQRQIKGEIAGRYCDIVILSEENDSDENGQEILEQIAEGAIQAGKIKDQSLYLVHHREEAIEIALAMAQAGDTVALLGKGHEKYILTLGEKPGEIQKRPYDEIAIAREALKSVN